MINDFLLMVVISLFTFLWIGKSFKRVVLFLAFFLPFEEFILKFMPVSDELYSLLRYGSELLLLITLIVLIFKKIVEKRPFVKTPVDLPVLLFACSAFLSGLLNQISLLEIALFLRIVLRYYALYFIVVNIDLDIEFAKKLIKGLIAIAVFQFSLGLAQVFIGEPINKILMPRPTTLTVGSYAAKKWLILEGLREKGHLVFGTFGDTVNLGLFILIVLVLVTAIFLITQKNKEKFWLFLIIGFFILCSTYSVGLVFTFMVVLLFMVFLVKRWGMLGFCGFLVGGVILMAFTYRTEPFSLIASNAPISPLENLGIIFSGKAWEVAKTNRLFTFFEVPSVIFSHSPLLGFGPNWSTVKDRIAGGYFLGDVYWSQILAQVGLIGLGSLLLIFYKFYKVSADIYKNCSDFLSKSLGLGFMGILVGVFLYDFVGPALEVRPLAFYFWLFGGLVTSRWLSIKNSQGDLSPAQIAPLKTRLVFSREEKR